MVHFSKEEQVPHTPSSTWLCWRTGRRMPRTAGEDCQAALGSFALPGFWSGVLSASTGAARVTWGPRLVWWELAPGQVLPSTTYLPSQCPCSHHSPAAEHMTTLMALWGTHALFNPPHCTMGKVSSFRLLSWMGLITLLFLTKKEEAKYQLESNHYGLLFFVLI